MVALRTVALLNSGLASTRTSVDVVGIDDAPPDSATSSENGQDILHFFPPGILV
jgi:hypothetical protein